VQRTDEPRDRRRRIRYRAAELSGVQIEIGPVKRDGRGDHAAHAGHRARHVRRHHAGVGDDDDVATEPIATVGEQRLEVRRTGLLLALDEELQRDRRRVLTGGREMRTEAEQVEQQLALVVGCPAGTQHVTIDRRVERVGVPQLQRVDRLHVVMGVDEHGRRVRVGARPFGEHGRQPRAVVPHLDGWETGAPRGVGEPLRAARDVVVMFGLGADAGDAQPLVEIGQ
jgi:hypothetical protein